MDLDFNYIGSANRQIMQHEKPELETILLDICKRRQYELHRNPKGHAGGKTVLVYKSLMGTKAPPPLSYLNSFHGCPVNFEIK